MRLSLGFAAVIALSTMSTLTRRPIVAQSAEVMAAGSPILDEFKTEGTNTLWLIPTGTGQQ